MVAVARKAIAIDGGTATTSSEDVLVRGRHCDEAVGPRWLGALQQQREVLQTKRKAYGSTFQSWKFDSPRNPYQELRPTGQRALLTYKRAYPGERAISAEIRSLVFWEPCGVFLFLSTRRGILPALLA